MLEGELRDEQEVCQPTGSSTHVSTAKPGKRQFGVEEAAKYEPGGASFSFPWLVKLTS